MRRGGFESIQICERTYLERIGDKLLGKEGCPDGS